MDLVEITKVQVGPRFRTDNRDMETLKKSMSLRGLIQPIVVDRSYNLIAGARRLACAKELQWPSIGYTFRDQVDELTAREIELEENLCREAFTAEEEVNAILAIHTLKQAKYGKAQAGSSDGWKLEDTALSLGISTAKAQMYISVGKNVDKFPSVRVALRDSGILEAFKTLRYEQEKIATNILSEIASQGTDKTVAEAQASENPEELLKACAKLVDEMLFNMDCLDFVKHLPDASIHLVHTDPPYAINIKDIKKTGEFKGDVYENDTATEFVRLWTNLAPHLYRILVPDSFSFVWISWTMMDTLEGIMRSAGFGVHPLPYVWIRLGTGYQSLNPSRYFASGVDHALIFTKGNPQLILPGKPNFSLERALTDSMKTHPLERPVPLVSELLETLALPGSLVFDPFAGGASTIKACIASTMKGIGCELDSDYYKRSRLELIRMLSGTGAKEDNDP